MHEYNFVQNTRRLVWVFEQNEQNNVISFILQGTHKSLKDNQEAKATVAAIINGTGSLGEFRLEVSIF